MINIKVSKNIENKSKNCKIDRILTKNDRLLIMFDLNQKKR